MYLKCLYIFSENTQILCLTESLAKECKNVHRRSTIDRDLLDKVELIFKSQSCLIGSFLLESERRDVYVRTQLYLDTKKAARVLSYLKGIKNEGLKSFVC